MNRTMKRLVATSLAVLLAGTAGAALAQVGPAKEAATPGTARHKEEMKDANEHVNSAIRVVHQMQATPEMKSLLQRAKGVFVVPKYGEAALGVGARGGAGVLLVRNGNTWSNPAFYNMGGITAGLQAGAEAGAIAFVLNDQKALNSFMQNNKFSLGADAGLTLVDWSTGRRRAKARPAGATSRPGPTPKACSAARPSTSRISTTTKTRPRPITGARWRRATS